MAVNQEKEKAIELAMSAVERQFGKGSIMRLGNEEPLVRDVQAISTGSISLDIAGAPGEGCAVTLRFPYRNRSATHAPATASA